MEARQGFGVLIKAAADLVQHRFMPSWVAEDYTTRTMSTTKVARLMEQASEQLKTLAYQVRNGADVLMAEVDARQAKIDALMLEFCPDEMTAEQKENWARNQRPAKSFTANAASPAECAEVRQPEVASPPGSLPWQSVDVLPPMKPGALGLLECRKLLVWVNETGMTGFARGSCTATAEGAKPAFRADGMVGEWKISHWLYVDAPGDASGRSIGTQQALTLTGRQVMDALEFVAGDCFRVIGKDSEIEFARQTFAEQMASEVSIGSFAVRTGSDGEAMPAGVYAWMADHPEEGSIRLGADESQMQSEAAPAV